MPVLDGPTLARNRFRNARDQPRHVAQEDDPASSHGYFLLVGGGCRAADHASDIRHDVGYPRIPFFIPKTVSDGREDQRDETGEEEPPTFGHVALQSPQKGVVGYEREPCRALAPQGIIVSIFRLESESLRKSRERKGCLNLVERAGNILSFTPFGRLRDRDQGQYVPDENSYRINDAPRLAVALARPTELTGPACRLFGKGRPWRRGQHHAHGLRVVG